MKKNQSAIPVVGSLTELQEVVKLGYKNVHLKTAKVEIVLCGVEDAFKELVGDPDAVAKIEASAGSGELTLLQKFNNIAKGLNPDGTEKK